MIGEIQTVPKIYVSTNLPMQKCSPQPINDFHGFGKFIKPNSKIGEFFECISLRVYSVTPSLKANPISIYLTLFLQLQVEHFREQLFAKFMNLKSKIYLNIMTTIGLNRKT